jgi:hypothetical protein
MDEESRQLTFELPAVRLPPFGELAAAARLCERLQAVRRLAEWTGDRRVTKTGNLMLADARAAVQEFGLPEHPKARAAGGFPELQDLWALAVDLELLSVDGGRAEYVAAVGDDRDRDVVELWIDLLALTLQDTVELPGDEQRLMPLMMRLYVDVRGLTVEDLVTHVLSTSVEAAPDELSRAIASLGPAVRPLFVRLIRRKLDALEAIDALVVDGDHVRLTHLGRFGLVHWFEMGGIGAPFVTDLADATVAEVLDLGLAQDSAFEEWLAAVGQDVAAARILEHARGGTPGHRVVAFGMLNQLGLVAEKGVRACLDDSDLRPHANAWLAAHGLPVGESSLDDLHRVFIDMVAADLDGDPRSARDSIRELAEDAEYDAAALFEDLWRCEHPAALSVLEALARYYPDPAAAKAARKGVMRLRSETGTTQLAAPDDSTYQLKVLLKHTKPPVWRRIQVPGSTTLAGLHAVIQVAMGWTNSHLHQFEINQRIFGDIDDDAPEELLEAADFTLQEVAQAGDRFDYLYDFGDGWSHTVTVEKVLPADSGPEVRCVAGKRNCPPEDVGGPWGFEEFLKAYSDPAHPDHAQYQQWAGDDYDAAAFDLDMVNAELAELLVD